MKSLSVAAALCAAVGVHAGRRGPPPYAEQRNLFRFLPVDLADDPDYRGSVDYNDWEMYDGGWDTEFSPDDKKPFRIEVTSSAEGGFVTGWNKDVYGKLPALEAETMVGSGFTVRDGGDITIQLRGLAKGSWGVQTFHNAWDHLSEVPSISVTVNGELQISDQEQSVRKGSLYDSASTYVTFESTGEPVNIVFTPSGGNAHLNGIEIDTANVAGIGREIQYPSPGNGDREVREGDVKARWESPPDMDDLVYNVYLGTEPWNLKTYQLGHEKTSITFKKLSAEQTYYWRVDTTDTRTVDVHYGRTLEFTTSKKGEGHSVPQIEEEGDVVPQTEDKGDSVPQAEDGGDFAPQDELK